MITRDLETVGVHIVGIENGVVLVAEFVPWPHIDSRWGSHKMTQTLAHDSMSFTKRVVHDSAPETAKIDNESV